MVHSLYGTGVLEKRLTQVKSVSGTMEWQCTDGRLTETGEHSYQFRLTAMDTLALCNLLFDNYAEIVEAARTEQRGIEEEHLKRGFPVEVPYR